MVPATKVETTRSCGETYSCERHEEVARHSPAYAHRHRVPIQHQLQRLSQPFQAVSTVLPHDAQLQGEVQEEGPREERQEQGILRIASRTDRMWPRKHPQQCHAGQTKKAVRQRWMPRTLDAKKKKDDAHQPAPPVAGVALAAAVSAAAVEGVGMLAKAKPGGTEREKLRPAKPASQTRWPTKCQQQ
eukprot:INCI4978.1.p1 GENE.INCI4978.1~~INCI4978.1.p1  ORF type:complete len:187 (+),score=24.58 INCI4978.1:161-721(+)